MPVREFRLPDLGEGLEDAEVVGWRVKEGDRVELNQTLVEVNTAKALVEIPAPWEGVVEKLHAAEGDVVKVGEPLVSIAVADPAARSADAEIQTAATPAEAAREGVQQAHEAGPKRRAVLVGYGVAEEEQPTGGAGEHREPREDRTGPVRSSPPVRRLAKELGVDLAALSGTGAAGRITRQDVLHAADAARSPGRAAGDAAARSGPTTARHQTAEVGLAERIPVRGTRRLIAEQMARSVREIPHVTTFLTVDASQVLAFRGDIERQTGTRVSPLAIVVRALVETCRDHPMLNASFDQDASQILVYGPVHVGIATDTDRGLLVPVVRDAGGRGILDVAAEIGRLSGAARDGTIEAEEMAGGTITVTNVGTFGAEFGTPILNFPQAAILALGVIEPRPLVVQGVVEARPAVTMSLSFDHRVMDGAEAGRALRSLADVLESPFRLGALPR